MSDQRENGARCAMSRRWRAAYFANSRMLTDNYARVFQGEAGAAPTDQEIVRALKGSIFTAGYTR